MELTQRRLKRLLTAPRYINSTSDNYYNTRWKKTPYYTLSLESHLNIRLRTIAGSGSVSPTRRFKLEARQSGMFTPSRKQVKQSKDRRRRRKRARNRPTICRKLVGRIRSPFVGII